MDLSGLRAENATTHQTMEKHLHSLDIKLTRVIVLMPIATLIIGTVIGVVIDKVF